MASVKLTYFDFAGSRGEDCRLALTVAGVPFDDDRVKDWPAGKAAAPLGALPVLTVEGKTLAQSNAILGYLGRKYGLLPKDEWQAAQHEAILGYVEDFRAKLGPLIRLKDEAEKKKQREEVAAGYMQEWGANLEKQIGAGPFFAGAQISVADIKVFVAMSAFLKGTIDYISTDVFKAFPKLTALFAAVKAHPKIVEWYAR